MISSAAGPPNLVPAGAGTPEPAAPVRLATGSDRGHVAAMLAAAFAEDPAFSYIFPDPVVRRRLLPRAFALLFDSDGRNGMRLVAPAEDGTVAAALLWRAPGAAHVGWGEMLRHALPLLAAFRGSVWRALRVADAVDAHHPGGDYWYLHILGCHPGWQRTGRAAALIHAGLDRVAGRLPSYLETANAANIAFYRRLGFDVTAEWRVKRGGPVFWSMLRPAG